FDMVFIPAFFFFIYSFVMKKKGSLIFLIGGLIAFSPFVIYYTCVLQTPAAIPGNFVNLFSGDSVVLRTHGNMETVFQVTTLPNTLKVFNNPEFIPHVIVRILFYPYRGLFFYYPFLLLFFPGLYFMYNKKLKKESILLLGIFLTTIIGVSWQGAWWGNFAFGPRRFVLLMPFLAIPILYCKKKIDRKILLSLVIISICVNFLGLQVWEGMPTTNPTRETLESWQSLGNPLANHYLPLLFENGPRSMLLENFLIQGKIGVWNAPQACKSYEYMERTEVPLGNFNNGILTLRIPFLSLFVILLILFLIWHGEIMTHFNIDKGQIFLLLFILIFLFTISFVRIRTHLAGSGWEVNGWGGHDSVDLSNSRKMNQNGTILIHSKEDIERELFFDASSFYRRRNLEIFVNERSVGKYSIPVDMNKNIIHTIDLKKGLNEIKFHSVDGCERRPRKCNLHCLSFEIKNFQIKDI
ncbi:MAG: hypothetical protein ABEK36_05230, partial [Candidatus Aenigmatarchaeota archaeon]